MPHKIAPPSSLYQQALAREEKRHEGRLLNLKLARAKLALLEEYSAGLKAAGAELWPEQIELMKDHIGKERSRAVHSLYIQFFELHGHRKGDNALKFLLANGFNEQYRHAYDTWATVTLSKGHLHLRFSVSHSTAAAGPAPAPTPATTA